MEETIKLVVFKLYDQRFAIDIQNVDRVESIVEINSVAVMPDYISGLINIHGEILPVIYMRLLFNLPEKELDLSDQLIIVNNITQRYALWVDNTEGVKEVSVDDIIKSDILVDGIPYLKGIFKDREEMIFINDIAKFLRPEDLALLNDILKDKDELVCVNL